MKKEYIIYWSGGEDSTATIILARNMGIPIKKIAISEVMFDKKREISGEHPEHISWLKDFAIPKIKSWGFEVDIIRDNEDYIDKFFHQLKRSNVPERVGKYAGFPPAMGCVIRRDLKLRPIENYKKKIGEHIEIVGICADERKRLVSLFKKKNKRSILWELNIKKENVKYIVKKENLRSPIYEHGKRGGCWFCPNATICEFKYLKEKHPNLFLELEKLSEIENTVSKNFKWGMSFNELKSKLR